MSSSFDLGAYWAQGDFVSHAIAIILIFLSITSWSVIAAKGWQLYNLRRQSSQLVESFWQAANFEDGLIRIAPIAPFAFVAQRASQAMRHYNDHSTDTPHLDANLSLGELVSRALRQGITR